MRAMGALPVIACALAGRAAAQGGPAGSAAAAGGSGEGRPEEARCALRSTLERRWAAGVNPDGSVDPDGKAVAARRIAPRLIDELPPAGPAGPDAASDTDVLHQSLDLEWFYDARKITGSNTMTVRSTVDGLSQFTIRLHPNFLVSSCTVDGVDAAISTPAAGSYGRTVTLPHAYNAQDVLTIVIGYTGSVSSQGFGSIEFKTIGGQPTVSTLSEPYYAGTWWPTKDGDILVPGDNSDKFTVEVAVTAPADYTTVSNGLLQGVDALPGNRARYRWASSYPIAPYLVSFASAKYLTSTMTYDYGAGTMPVQFYVASASSNDLAQWQKSVAMLGVYRDIFGLYPFINEKYAVYQFTFSGGMEHQTCTGMGVFSESITAHELAHQWWGDNITCRTWNHIWLNEGFATYGQSMWDERKSGSASLTALQQSMANHRPSNFSGTVYRSDTKSVSSIFDSTNSYNKAAWVLHMLRHAVGDANFFAGLANYRAHRQGGAAVTEDFFADMGQTCGRDLTYLMNQWIYSPGAVDYQYGWQPFSVNGRHYARLLLKQTQSTNYPTYDLPLDVRLNSNTTYTTLHNFARVQSFVIPSGSPVASVTLDPGLWLLTITKTSIAYAPGSPKILQTTPAPGQTVGSLAPNPITVTFSEDVLASAEDFAITGPDGSVPFAYSYNPGNFTATLEPLSSLYSGMYSVAISDHVTSAAAGIALDGEVRDAQAPGSLPSGDGLAGGAGLWDFSVECSADIDGSGFVDRDDFDDFVHAFEAGLPGADIDGSGFVDAADFTVFVEVFEAGC